MKKLRITIGQNVYEVSVEEIDGSSSPAPAAPVARVAPASSGPAGAAPAPAPKPAAPAGPGEVTSPLAGKVVSVDVQLGAAVVEGDRVATIEAMKMNTYIFALRSGKVTSITVAPGDAVEEGQIIARID